MLRTKGFSTAQFQRHCALRFPARHRAYKLNAALVRQATEFVAGLAGRCDEAAAHEGIEWMREDDRNTRCRGVTP
jgi:hypothetical protein